VLYIPQSMKRCSKCGEWKLATKHYFSRSGRRLRDCIKCRNANQNALRKYRMSRKPSPASGILYQPQSLRRCTSCDKWKLASAVYFKLDKRALCVCRECDRAYHHAYQMNNKDAINQRARRDRQRRGDAIKERGRKYYAQHKEKFSQRARKYYQENKVRVKSKVREYRESNKERISARAREYRQSHRDRLAARRKEYYSKNRQSLRQQQRQYQSTEHGRRVTQAVRARHKYRKRTLVNTLTGDQWKAALDYFNHKCAVCGRDLYGLFHTAAMDHWIPLKSPSCPGTVATNIVPLCHATEGGEGGCNNNKGYTDARTWLVRSFGSRRAREVIEQIEAYFDWVRAREAEKAKGE